MSKSIDLTPELTEKGIAELKTGQVLGFNYEGSPLYLKIVRKANGKVWAKETQLYTQDEMQKELEKKPSLQ